MKKSFIFSGLVIAAIAVVSLPFLTSSKEQENSSPEVFVQNYIELGQESNYEELADLVIDDRFNDDREMKISTYEMLEKDVPALESYEIKEVKDVTADSATVVTLLEFKDGSIEQRPMYLVKKDTDWKLHISAQNASDDEDYKQIKQPDGA